MEDWEEEGWAINLGKLFGGGLKLGFMGGKVQG